LPTQRGSKGAAKSGPISSAALAKETLNEPSSAALARAVSADECAALARACEQFGDLRAARSAWLEAAKRRDEFLWRQACDGRAREADYRIALCEELVDFARLDEATANLLGERRQSGESAGLPELSALELSNLLMAVDRAQLSNKARLGWTLEALQRGNPEQLEIALQQLGSACVRGDIDAARASGLVSRAKGETGDSGWQFQDGSWMQATQARREEAEAARLEREGELARRVAQFVRSALLERDRLFAKWLDAGDTELLSRALSERSQEILGRVERSPQLRVLANLADERRALDAARATALALIFDEVRYFYPYNPPECPPDKAAKYPAVQREVDVLVGEVRKIFEGAKRVRIGSSLREQLADLSWTREHAMQLQVVLPPLPQKLRYLLALPAAEEFGLREFAWDGAERAELDLWDRIEARNEQLWTALERAKPADEVPGADERTQVRITNAYRRMLGRRVLAWNPKLQAAAQGHSDYMANTGNFGHTEAEDPKRRSPMDRMQLVGYTQGVSENVCMGRGDPKSAHEGWTHSSGHHRNLLERNHREMASAIASSYWTQNFGLDTSFLADL
jgi:hypothetical protein